MVTGELKRGLFNRLLHSSTIHGTPPALLGKEWRIGERTAAVISGDNHHCPNCYGIVFTTHAEGDYSDLGRYECVTCHIHWEAELGKRDKSWRVDQFGKGYNELRTAIKVTRAKEGL